MSKHDKQAQDWVNNPHAWQDHEEDFLCFEFINSLSIVTQYVICGLLIGYVFYECFIWVCA